MPNAARQPPLAMTAEEFLATDQSRFGPAWRYELLDGQLVAQAAPTPEHGAIVVNLGAALKARLKGTMCRPEAATAAIPHTKTADRARIPDVMIRCEGRPLVLFEVISPADDRSQIAKAERFRDLKSVDGVKEIVEIVQDEFLCRVHRWRGEINGWQMDEITGADEVLRLSSVQLEIPLEEIYDQVLTDAP